MPAVVACSNRVSNYGDAGIRIDRPPSAVTVIGNRFEGDADQAAVSLSDGQGIVEDNRRDEKK